MPENIPDMPVPEPNEKRHYEGERVRSPNDQRDPMSEHRDPTHPTNWSPARPYDSSGRVRTDAHRARVRDDVQAHLRRHQGR